MLTIEQLMALPRSRSEAIAIGSKLYFTDRPCKYGHVAERRTKDKVCQECNREKSRAFSLNFPEKKKQQQLARYWRDPEKRRSEARRYASENSEEARMRAKKWRLDNPERASHNDREKRARKRNAGGSYSLDQVTDLLLKQGYQCVYCRADIRKKNNRHVDHIMPLKLGGTNDISNIQLLCPRCNMSKKAMHPDDYARRIGKFEQSGTNMEASQWVGRK